MAVLNGTAVNFGFTSTSGANGITITVPSGLSGLLLQSAKQRKKADLEVTRDGIGDEVTHGWYNPHDEADLEFVISAAGIAAAITATTTALMTAGTLVTISECLSMPSLVGTTWEVQDGAEISGSNTTSKRATIPLKKYPKITAVASS